MKTSLPLVVLLLVALWLVAAAPPPQSAGQAKRASWDDVNVVAHGLLQLGQGLKEHVDKTKAQMREVDGKLRAFNGTVAELERRQRQQGESLAARLKELEDRERSLEELAKEVRAGVEEANGRSEGFLTRMEKVEEKVEGSNSDDSGVPFLQRLLSAQNRRIDQLVDKIKQQQDKLEKQSLHLQALQRKVAQKRVKSHGRRDEDTALRGEPASSAQTAAVARDCQDLFTQGQRTSGVYTVQPEGSRPFNVFCEMTTEGGWTVIQKRFDGSQDFNQLWQSYKNGFGDLNGEFWLGLDHIHALASQGRYLLRVELSDWRQQPPDVATYGFQLAGEEQQFALRLQEESSTQERLLTTGTSGLPFSTADRDSDSAADVNCAQLLSGGWWFSSCGESNLNGRYLRRPSSPATHHLRRRGMFWTSSKGQNYSIRTSVLKIAPATIKQ